MANKTSNVSASKWHGQPCPLCGEGVLKNGTRSMLQTYKGRDYATDAYGAFCTHCGDGFVEFDKAEEDGWLAFRNQVDADEAADLIRIRKKLKLTQLQAAQIAGGGKNAFSRYERGQARPVAAVTNLFRLLDRHPELLGELQSH